MSICPYSPCTLATAPNRIGFNHQDNFDLYTFEIASIMCRTEKINAIIKEICYVIDAILVLDRILAASPGIEIEFLSAKFHLNIALSPARIIR